MASATPVTVSLGMSIGRKEVVLGWSMFVLSIISSRIRSVLSLRVQAVQRGINPRLSSSLHKFGEKYDLDSGRLPRSSEGERRGSDTTRRCNQEALQYLDSQYLSQSSSQIDETSKSSPQFMLCLCGIPGSGKTTFAQELALLRRSEETAKEDECARVNYQYQHQQQSGAPVYTAHNCRRKWTIVSQDVLKSRKAVLAAAKAALLRGDHVVVDRCNFDKEQRHHWIDLASEVITDPDTDISFHRDKNRETRYANGTSMIKVSITMEHAADLAVASDRATCRGIDDQHQKPVDWSTVCRQMLHRFTPPSVEEGFDVVYECLDGGDRAAILSALARF
jgi:predicted kinase